MEEKKSFSKVIKCQEANNKKHVKPISEKSENISEEHKSRLYKDISLF